MSFKTRLALLPLIAGAQCLAQSSQNPFIYPSGNKKIPPQTPNQFGWPIKRVAIIGAGVGGITAYRELKDNFDVHIFERDFLPGGTWHYTDETPFPPSVPNAPVVVADYIPSLPPQGVKLPYTERCESQCVLARRDHRKPKPIWYNLKSNSPAPVQQIREFPWPEGTEWQIPQHKIGRYVRSFATWHGVNTNDDNPNVSYNTRVELIEKRFDDTGKQNGWTLTTKEVSNITGDYHYTTWNKQDFDAVVVASGRFNAPNMAPIEGLEKWREVFPDNVSHTRQYRRPEPLAGKTVLIVGAADSGGQISREINPYVSRVYQSIRPERNSGPHPGPTLADYVRQLPLNTTIISEIRRFHSPGSNIQESVIELKDGTNITGVDHIIFATGFLYTYPFLPEYHNPTLGRTGEVYEGSLQPLVTDGSHLRSLHLDTFYIDNPTLAFVNMNFGIPAFVYPEFQSLAICKVWSGKAYLPSREEMWALYRERVRRVGYGKYFSNLGYAVVEEVFEYIQGWLNTAAAQSGGRLIDGLSHQWWEVNNLWDRARFGDPLLIRNVTIPGPGSKMDAQDFAQDEDVIYNALETDSW